MRPYNSEPRYLATGASYHQEYVEGKPASDHLYMNNRQIAPMGMSRSTSQLDDRRHQNATQLTRRSSERSDYRLGSSLNQTPRGNGSVVVTSGGRVPQMIAQEISVRPNNVIDNKMSTRSPQSPRRTDESAGNRYENDVAEAYRKDSSPQPMMVSSMTSSFRQPSGSPHYAQVQVVSNPQANNLRDQASPNRYTQASTSNLATRNPLELSNQMEGMSQEQTYSPRNSTGEQRYLGQNMGPDYENVYQAQMQNEMKRPIQEHDESRNRPVPNLQINVEPASGPIAAVKICPMCNQEFSRLKMEEFQMHVFDCFDSNEEGPVTLQAGNTNNDDDRTCPMCSETFPLTIPQETYEQHVLAHFGEDPQVEHFEMVQN